MLATVVCLPLIVWKLMKNGDELRMLRVAYELAEDEKARAAKIKPPPADDDSRLRTQIVKRPPFHLTGVRRSRAPFQAIAGCPG